MEIATVLLIVGCVAAGVTGALVTSWSLRSKLFSLEDRLSIVEGTVTREVKTRAGQERWKKADKDEALLTALKSGGVTGRTLNWWEKVGTPK